MGDFTLFFLQFPRLEVTRIASDAGSIIYVGNQDSYMNTLLRVLFPEGYDQTSLERIAVWKLPKETNNWLQNDDLVLTKTSRIFPWHPKTKYSFTNAVSVYQILSLEKPFDELFSGGENKRLRHQIQRMLRENYQYRISHDEADLHYFYDQIYVPTAHKRHGERAIIMSYDAIKELFQNGFLVCLSLDNQIVSIDLCVLKDSMVHDLLGGVLDGDEKWMERAVGIAAYYYVIKTANDLGAKSVNFLASFACVSDGIFQVKQRWGSRVHPFPHVNSTLRIHANQITDLWRTRVNEIGFITSHEERFLRVYLDSPDLLIEDGVRLARKNGLDGIQVVDEKGRQNYFL
jgi:regulator of replication initiation timing